MRGVLLAFGLLVVGAAAPAGKEIGWRSGPNLERARDNLGFGAVDGSFIVAGGAYWRDEVKHFSPETTAYQPGTRKWVPLPSLPHAAAYGASGVYKGELMIAGGMGEGGSLIQCLRLSKKQGRYRWDALPDLPYPVAGARGAVIGTRFLLIGGAPSFDEPGLKSACRAVLELDLLRPTQWKEHSAAKEFQPRIGAAMAALGDTAYVFGGYGVRADGTIGNFGDAWSVRNGVWKRIRGLPIKLRWATAVALDSRYIGIFGGYGEDFLADVYLYDARRNVYLKSTRMPLAVANAAASTIGKTVYLAGGEDQKRHRTAALFVGTLR